MADEAPAAEAKPKKKLPMTAIIIAGITLIQAGGFFAAFKFLGGSGPQATHGAEGEHYAHGEEPTSKPAPSIEVPLLQRFKVPNTKSGATFIYDFDVVVVVAGARKEEMEKLKAERAGEISDRLAQIIRAADQQMLAEDDFQTLRLQMQIVLGAIAGDKELVQRVLIPRCVPIRAD